MRLFGRKVPLQPTIPEHSTHAVILVHGFNGREDKVVLNYLVIAKALGIENFKIIGYLWKSVGRVGIIAYAMDRTRVNRSAWKELKAGIQQLRDAGFTKVTLVAHSMGSVVACEAIRQGADADIIIHGGDALRKHFRPGKRYGQLHTHLTSFYSAADRVLNLAHVLIPWIRVGEKELPIEAVPVGQHPGRYVSIDACAVSGKRIRHTDYKSDSKVLAKTAQILAGAG